MTTTTLDVPWDVPTPPAAAPAGRTRGRAALLGAVGVALAVVIVAPIALSSSDLVRWAADPAGLGLAPAWAWLTFVALDCAAASCVGMVVYSAWRGEGGGMFHVLTWVFAAGSATANYRHGQTTPARDDAVFFAAMSLTGPLLLDVTLSRVRRWVRQDDGRQLSARPRFGMRWLPGVAFRQTVRAWQAALREDIARPADAIAHVRDVEALRQLSPTEQLRYAWHALGSCDLYSAHRWLQSRGVVLTQATIDEATAAMPRPPRPVVTSSTPAPALPAAAAVPAQVPSPMATPPAGMPAVVDLREVPDLGAMTKRDALRHAFAALGTWDVPAALSWLAERGVTVDRRDAARVARAEQDRRVQLVPVAGGAS